MVAVVYWCARLAVNEEVWVQSPSVTQRLGVGQWLATWPGTRSTQVRFLPPRPTRALTNGRQPVPKTGVVVMSPRGSIPPLSSLLLTALSANGRRPGPQPGNGGFDSPQRHAQSPRQVDRGQDYESRLRRSNRLGGTTNHGDVLEW
jgi:hypothetical protein